MPRTRPPYPEEFRREAIPLAQLGSAAPGPPVQSRLGCDRTGCAVRTASSPLRPQRRDVPRPDCPDAPVEVIAIASSILDISHAQTMIAGRDYSLRAAREWLACTVGARRSEPGRAAPCPAGCGDRLPPGPVGLVRGRRLDWNRQQRGDPIADVCAGNGLHRRDP